MSHKLLIHMSILGVSLGATAGCSWFPTFDEVIPDRSKAYQKSESMPDLEVPPDLSSDSISDSLSVPEVDAKGSASYSTYHERIARRGDTEREAREPESAASPIESSEGSPEEQDEVTEPEEEEKETAALGAAADEEAEPETEPEEEAEAEDEAEIEEPDEGKPASAPDRHEEAEGPGAAVGETGTGLAQLVTAGQGKKYLRVTEGFSESWRLTGQALAEAGFTVSDEDRDRGVYFVDFAGPAAQQSGFLSSLAFWRGGDSEHELQLTGIGEKTEVVVLDEDGNWESGPAADEILTRLETALNRAGK